MSAIVGGFLNCLEPATLLAMFLAVFLGIIIGALPGFGAATGLILILPLTYSMDSSIALVALVGVYVGAEYGGSISSILLNTPGTGGAVVTCFDGFPLAQKGKPGEALLYSNVASCVGGMLGGLIMLLFLPLLVNFAFVFGAGEIFFMALIGLTLVGTVSNGDLAKGLASIGIGILLSTVGTDAASGVPRFYFDYNALFSGIPNIPVMLGLFSLPFLVQGVVDRKHGGEAVIFHRTTFSHNFRLFRGVSRDMAARMKMTLARSSLMGILIGIIPGVGAAVATFLAYSTAKDSSPHPEEFGKGEPEGIVAPESANNAIVGGSLIPVLSLGIPGSPAAAIFMGAIFMHGMMPGPTFMEQQPVLVYTVVCAVIVASLMQALFGALGIGFMSNILKVPLYLLIPSVISICAIGAYAMRGTDFDIELFVIFGIAGFFLIKLNYSIAAITLGMILGRITEVSLTEAVNISSSRGGIFNYFIHRPLSLTLLAVLLIYMAWLFHTSRRKTRAMQGREQGPVPTLMQGMRCYDLLLGLAFLAAAAALVPEARSYPRTASIFPLLSLGLLGLSSLYILLRALFMPGHYRNASHSPFAGMVMGRAFFLFVVIVVYAAAVINIGFYLSTLVFSTLLSIWLYTVFHQQMPLNARRIALHLVYGLIFTVSLYAVFTHTFLMQLPDQITI